jgi:hypothetical protein
MIPKVEKSLKIKFGMIAQHNGFAHSTAALLLPVLLKLKQ